VTDIKEVKVKPEAANFRANPKNWSIIIFIQQGLCQWQAGILIQPIARNLKCDVASKADQVPKL
jgi:hypothetical protein